MKLWKFLIYSEFKLWRLHISTYTYTHTYTQIYIHILVIFTSSNSSQISHVPIPTPYPLLFFFFKNDCSISSSHMIWLWGSSIGALSIYQRPHLKRKQALSLPAVINCPLILIQEWGLLCLHPIHAGMLTDLISCGKPQLLWFHEYNGSVKIRTLLHPGSPTSVLTVFPTYFLVIALTYMFRSSSELEPYRVHFSHSFEVKQ